MEHAVLQTAASQFVQSYGSAAALMLRARADQAAERGHVVAAATWRQIAEATAALGAAAATGTR